MGEHEGASGSAAASDIATAFVEARLTSHAINTYPGSIPESLAAAYIIQDQAIDLWPDEIAGWKIGRITGAAEQVFGVDRLAGPIFRNSVRHVARASFLARLFGAGRNKLIEMPVFRDGFAAVEAEIIFIVAKDAPETKIEWTGDEAKSLIGEVAAGIEIASSPFAGINDFGPLVTISDFGNNYGLIIGEEIPGWRRFEIDDWRCSTSIDGKAVGEGVASSMPGGPVESLRFLLENAARRGRPLKKGMVVSTGAVTGVHQVGVGQIAAVRFQGLSEIRCRLVAAK